MAEPFAINTEPGSVVWNIDWPIAKYCQGIL